MSTTTLATDWGWIETLGDLRFALPAEPERPGLGEGAGAGPILIASEFGDGFAICADGLEHLSAAVGLILDELYGLEWGTAEAPTIVAGRGVAGFVAFGERYRAVWRELDGGVVLLALARPEREARALAFVAGASLR